MTILKHGVFHLFFLLSGVVACPQTITLLDNYYLCNACNASSPKIPQSQIKQQLTSESSLLPAAQKISRYFTADGDRFILLCKTCEVPPRTYGFKQTYYKTPDKKIRGFGNYLGSNYGSTKGGEEFYTLNDVLMFLTDSVLIFDSIDISTAMIANKNTDILSSLTVSLPSGNTVVNHLIPYNQAKQTLRLTYASLLGGNPKDSMSRLRTDALTVTLHYTNEYNEQEAVAAPVKVFFASPQEKKDILSWYVLYKTTFPDWTTDEIADELLFKIRYKYKNAVKYNFIKWLQQQH